MFIYCHNNPVNMTDETGNLPFLAITAIVGAVVGAVVGGVVAAKKNGNIWAGIGIGATAGALIGSGVGAVAGVALVGSATASTGAVIAGGSSLIGITTTSGLDAGATYVANNMSRATGKVSSVAQTVSKMQQVAAKGKAGELTSGVTKNTTRIYDNLISGAKYRIPDGLTSTTLSEVKNYSGTLSYTAQLKDFVSYSKAHNLQMYLYTNAQLTAPLQEVVDSGVIQVFPLK